MSELEELRRWKAEALVVAAMWDKVADLAEEIEPAPLGWFRSDHALKVMRRLRACAERRCTR